MIDVDYNEYKATLEENMQLIQENHKLKEELKKEKNKNKKAFKILDNALTEQMIKGETSINLVELCAILQGSDKK